MNLFYFSVTDWDGIDLTKNFVGLDNYVRVFTDPRIFGVFGVSLYYFIATFAQMAIALYFATILSFSTRFQNLFRGILFFPYLINGVAIGFVFLYLFQPGGTLDTVLSWFGRGRPAQVAGRPRHRELVAGRHLGLAVHRPELRAVPRRHPVDPARALRGGGTRRREHGSSSSGRSSSPASAASSASRSSSRSPAALSVFEIPFIMTGGANGSATFVIQTLQTAFSFRQVGLASAMAVVLLVIVLIVTVIQRKIFPDDKVDLT